MLRSDWLQSILEEDRALFSDAFYARKKEREVRKQLELSFSKIGKIARSALGLNTDRFRDISFNVPRGIKMAIQCNFC